MARLIIEQVRGGFFLVDGNDRSVASIDTLAVEVRCWADSLPVIQPRVLPPVAPDAAPAPFRVGDRVVFRNRNKRQDPLTITQIRGDGCRIATVAHIWYDMLEFRHAPVKDL